MKSAVYLHVAGTRTTVIHCICAIMWTVEVSVTVKFQLLDHVASAVFLVHDICHSVLAVLKGAPDTPHCYL